MKKIIVLIAMAILTISCDNAAKQSYQVLSEELSNADLYDCDLQTLKEYAKKIDSHLTSYPDYSENGNLISIKETIIDIADNETFNQVIAMTENVLNGKYGDYDEAIESINDCIDVLNQYIEGGRNQENRNKARNMVSNFQTQINNIGEEKSSFYDAIYSNDVYALESFLREYPNSVMKGSVIDRMDQLYYSSFLNEFNGAPNSIEQLNRSVNVAKGLLVKLQSIEVKSQVSEAIANLEGSRREVMEAELNDKLQDLMDLMESTAKDKAKRAHPTYNVEMCSARGSNPEIVGNSSTFERLYQVNMRGAFIGIDKREMMVAVSGRISGNLNTGVNIQVTGSRIDMDVKK